MLPFGRMATDIVPIFRVADVRRSVEWYARLGFEQVFEHRFEPELPAYVGLRREGAQLHLSEHAGDASPGGLAYLWVEAVDPLANEFDATIDEMPWARDFEVTDPDGNRLRVAEPIDS